MNRWDAYPGTNIPYITNTGPAYLDSVKWVPILEAGQRANEIEGGTVNVVKNPAGAGHRAAAGQRRSRHPSASRASSNYFIGLNAAADGAADSTTSASARRSRTRSTAQSLADSIFFGQAVATYGPIAPNFKWYEAGVEQFNQFDPEKAKSLLDEAGWTEGSGGIREKGGQKLSFTITSNDNYQPTTAAIDQAIVPMLADVGVEMKLNVPDAAEYFGDRRRGGDPDKALTGRRLGLRVAVVVAGRPADLLPGVSQHGLQRRPAGHRGRRQQVADGAGRGDARGGRARVPARLGRAASRDPDPDPERHLGAPDIVMGYTPLETMLYPFYNDVYIAS